MIGGAARRKLQDLAAQILGSLSGSWIAWESAWMYFLRFSSPGFTSRALLNHLMASRGSLRESCGVL